MENVLFDEQTINANIQYALSIIAENVDKNGNLIVPEPVSMDETTKLFAKMVGNPQKSFADIAKSPKAAMTMNNIIIQGVELFKNFQLSGCRNWGMTNTLQTKKLDNFYARNRSWNIRLAYFF